MINRWHRHGRQPKLFLWNAQIRTHPIESPGAEVAPGKPQTLGTAKEHKRQGTPTINTNVCQSAQLTDQAPGTIERAAQEPSRITPTSTAALHASSTATSPHYYAHPAGSPRDHHSKRSPMRCTGRLTRTTTQTPHAPAGTRGAPRLGGSLSGGTDGHGQPRTHGQPLGRLRGEGGGGGGEGRGGRAKARGG